ncbi:hypothetical protein MMC28_001927 [Mycoblastus sanguinarius]|nr:hypothetical protein [Mycoblastus sanguinarius]
MSSTSPFSKSLPTSWTDDKDDLQAARFSSKEYRLGPGKMILYNNAMSTYLVECDGKYLLWNEVSDGIDQIKEPTKLEDILKVLPDASNYKVPDFSKMKLAGLEIK